jgi:hypothetical protein
MSLPGLRFGTVMKRPATTRPMDGLAVRSAMEASEASEAQPVDDSTAPFGVVAASGESPGVGVTGDIV